MSSRATEDRSSGPYPSQSTKYSSQPPRFSGVVGPGAEGEKGLKRDT